MKKKLVLIFSFLIFSFVYTKGQEHDSSQKKVEVWILNILNSKQYYLQYYHNANLANKIYKDVSAVLFLAENKNYILEFRDLQGKKIFLQNKGRYEVDKQEKKLKLISHNAGGFTQESSTNIMNLKILQNALILFRRDTQLGQDIPYFFIKMQDRLVKTKIEKIRMKIEAAEIALLKKDGTPWDPSDIKISNIADAASVFCPQAQFLKLIECIPLTARPDPFVTIRILENGMPIFEFKTDKVQGEYCPIYNKIFEFTIDSNKKHECYEIEFSVMDKDIRNDDSIGTITLPLHKFFQKEKTILEAFDQVRQLRILCWILK